MKKVIVKCKLENSERLEDKMAKMEMDFSPIYWLHDRVYVPRGYKQGMNLPRMMMRTEMRAVDRPAKYSVILKRHIEDSGVDIVEETEVRDYVAMVGVILQLGFKEIAEVSRRRQEVKIGEGVMMYMDSLDGAEEKFAKLETVLADGDTVEAARADLKKTFEMLGEKKIVEVAYFEKN